MKIVFFGTPAFAASILEALVKRGHDIVAIVTKPDKPQGRSLHMSPPEVKRLAAKILPSIPLFQPEKCSRPEFIEILKNIPADLYVVVAYGEIISQSVLDLPKFGCINVHGSILPKYRGAAPIQRAIMNGEKETGISIIRMVKKMDAGNVLTMEKCSISDEMTFGSLELLLREKAVVALLRAIDQIAAGKTEEITQDESQVTFANKITPEECQINWQMSAISLHNLVRGANPYPGAWCEVQIRNEAKRMKVWKTQVLPELPGSDSQLVMTTGDGILELLEVQLEGKPRQSARDFLNGYRNQVKFL